MQGYNKDYHYLGIQRIFRLVLQSDQNLPAFCFVHKYSSSQTHIKHKELKQTVIYTNLLFFSESFPQHCSLDIGHTSYMDHRGEDWKTKVILHRSNKEHNTLYQRQYSNIEHFLLLSHTYVQELRNYCYCLQNIHTLTTEEGHPSSQLRGNLNKLQNLQTRVLLCLLWWTNLVSSL